MKYCFECSESIPTYKRDDAKFCGVDCRHRAKRRVRTCQRCKLHHPSVGAPTNICAPCQVYDKIMVEKQAFLSVVEWMFSHAVCFYCGEHAVNKEHVVPRSTLYPTWIVPSCVECNQIAGAKLFDSVVDKMQYIQDFRSKKYAKLMLMPDWTWDEIEELGKNLRAKVEASQKAKDVVKSQLLWNPLALKAMLE